MPSSSVNAGNDYYPMEKYAKTKDNDEIYAKRNKMEFYLINKDNEEIMAKQHNSKKELVPYFALDAHDIPICPILKKDQKCLAQNLPYPKKNNIERYPKRHNHEYYIDKGSGMGYAKNNLNDEYCATNSQHKKYYASKTSPENEEIEYPPRDHQNKTTYIEDSNTVIYPLNITKNLPIYSKDNEDNEVYFQKKNVEIYGCNKSRLPIYAKYKSGDDRPALRNKVPHYSFFEKEGKVYQYYPKSKDNSEFYIKEGTKDVYAKFDTAERYAKTQNKDDILAENNKIPYYATDGQNIEMYPSSGGKTFYRKEANIEKIAFNKTTNEGFYAKNTDKDEFYPKDFNVVPEEEIEIVNVNVPTEPTDDEIKKHISSRP